MESNSYVKAGNGTLYKNDKKTNDTQPDYQGPITVIETNGDERKLRISVWKTPDKDYEMSFQLQLKKDEGPEQAPF